GTCLLSQRRGADGGAGDGPSGEVPRCRGAGDRYSATAAAAAQRPVQPGRAGQHPAQRSQGRAGVHARPPLQGGRVNRNDETYDQVRVTTLDNGLRVATDPMATVDTVSLGIWAGVGTRNEPKEINGVAHLLEH